MRLIYNIYKARDSLDNQIRIKIPVRERAPAATHNSYVYVQVNGIVYAIGERRLKERCLRFTCLVYYVS